MSNAIERVAAACPLSKYKDDRHEWQLVMNMLLSSLRPVWMYHALRRCEACKLTVLLTESADALYNSAPVKTDTIIYAFYPCSAPRIPA